MRIGCLQFAPQVGDVDNNLNRADAVLSRSNPQNLDLLVLPELAFTGYNFKSLQHISPYLEPTTAGITSLWARTTALKYDCVVTAGYPEKVDISPRWPASPEYYNSAITVNAGGETIANYRKSFLYYTDETWALEGPDGFYDGAIEGLGNVAMGICNPYKFEAPWSAWEFAYHILHKQANLVIISMAWLTREDARAFSRTPKEPDMETLSYWIARFEPLIRAENDDEIIVVLANRCGTEDDAVYAGTSAVLGIQSGEVKVYGILGRGERELLVVDTTRPPQAKLVSEPNSTASAAKRDADLSIPKTNSSVSTKSARSGQSTTTNLSVKTETTATTTPSLRSPSTPEAFTMDDILAPLSPVDPGSPTSFFAKPRQTDHPQRRASLRSSVEQVKQIEPDRPDSPSFYRSSCPQSRGSNRNHQPEIIEPDVESHDLTEESLAASRMFGVGLGLHTSNTPPHSASAAPDHGGESKFSNKANGLKSPITSARPKSVNW
ncbi:carbon-nitrogen hydrolase [Leptodontidium sp. MPI-SDFR-AT-0119]|nr:carbon-nitrogen hydrolase [Leptodontidium sp. MPI-SDFR-AT-0119]